MAEHAIIFDVDGVLLELTREEEELFFEPFASRCDASKLSRNWNSYEIRNDKNIVAEIVKRHGLPSVEMQIIPHEYLHLLQNRLASGDIKTQIIAGAENLLQSCASFAALGIATANFREAAKLRLENAALWHYVSTHAEGADGGGHKHEILGRALAKLNLPKSRIVYIGDNVNDVVAGLTHGVQFIGFSQSPTRLQKLHEAGATHLSSDHTQTLALIKTLLTP